MKYPTLEDVEKANHRQLCVWWRFLPSPGMGDAGKPTFDEALTREMAVMKRLEERYNAAGGMTPEISKSIGWSEAFSPDYLYGSQENEARSHG